MTDKAGNLTEGHGHDRSMGNVTLVVLGGIFVLNAFLLKSFFPVQAFAAELSAILGAFILSFPIIWAAAKDLLSGKVYMNELVALAILAALAGSDFRTAGIIAFFLLITVIIESRTADGARRSVEALVKLTPQTACKLTDEGEVEVNASELRLGDLVRIRPGDNFPVDGEVVKGESTVNQASITGESLPVEKTVGNEVYAGTQNLTGGVDVRVTRRGEDTTLGKVKEMLLAAENCQTPFVRIIDRYAAFYTPTVLMLAALTWWLSDGDMKRVITLMIIACPCAIVLATSTAVVAAVAAAARLGILIKNVSHLELASRIRTFIFDKTGTLTEGILSVARLVPATGIEPAELLQAAASAEAGSNHPTARALLRLAEEAGLALREASGFTEFHGKGVCAVIDGRRYQLGRMNWLESLGIDIAGAHTGEKETEYYGMSIIYVARDGQMVGWIGFKDKLRPAASGMVQDLKRLGVTRCAMITGDRQSVAETMAAQLRLDDFRSECLPEHKVEYIRNVKQTSLAAMVGDGVNDAPALASADLSIAMGFIGSDIAVNSASIALMTNDLRRIPLLVELSRKSRIIINQNLFIGMLFVFGGMILSVFGWLAPITAAILHASAVLLIIFNSARLIRTGDDLLLTK